MALFGNYDPATLVEAAEKVFSKMDERDLATAIEKSERMMSADGRALLVEAIFDAFRQRGESSQDALESAGTTHEAIARADDAAVKALLAYARANPGLLKEAASALVEREPHVLAQLTPELVGGIERHLQDR